MPLTICSEGSIGYSIMSSATSTISPSLRTLAAGTLLVWLAALACCADLCAQGETSPHCNGVAADSHHHHDGDSEKSGHRQPCGSSCLTLKNALLASHTWLAFHPASQPIYTLPGFALTLDTTLSSRWIFRQAKTPDWVLTPEVCLGPAFHSLAPPVLLLA